MTRLKAKPPELIGPGHVKGICFGRPGSGKTWFTLQFPRAYYFDIEGGALGDQYRQRLLDAGGVYLGREQGAGDPEVIIDQLKALATEKHDYRTVILDSGSKLYQTELSGEQDRLGDKDAYGASKKLPVRTARRLGNVLTRLDMNVWIVAHESAEYGQVGGKREQIGVMPDLHDKLIYDLNLTLQIVQTSKGNRRAIVHEKSRLMGFPGGDSFNVQVNGNDVGYDEFAKRYGREYLEVEAKVEVLATPEQVAEIRRLLENVKVEDGWESKVLTKAHAETWDELPTDKAQATIEFLKKKVIP